MNHIKWFLRLNLISVCAIVSLHGQGAPAPTLCSALDEAFVTAYTRWALGVSAVAWLSALYGIPRLLRFSYWWLTRPDARLIRLAFGCGLISLAIMLLPWLDATYDVGIGVSILPYFQVDETYLACNTVSFSHRSFLPGDFTNSATTPAIYLLVFQFLTWAIVFGGFGLFTLLIKNLLVKRQLGAILGRS